MYERLYYTSRSLSKTLRLKYKQSDKHKILDKVKKKKKNEKLKSIWMINLQLQGNILRYDNDLMFNNFRIWEKWLILFASAGSILIKIFYNISLTLTDGN